MHGALRVELFRCYGIFDIVLIELHPIIHFFLATVAANFTKLAKRIQMFKTKGKGVKGFVRKAAELVLLGGIQNCYTKLRSEYLWPAPLPCGQHMTHSQMFQKVESGGGPIFKVVLEC